MRWLPLPSTNHDPVRYKRGMRRISRETVLHVARLARLELTDTEAERMTHELGAILAYMDVLGAAELGDSETHKREATDAVRPDVVVAGLSRELACVEAPHADADGIVVPAPFDTSNRG